MRTLPLVALLLAGCEAETRVAFADVEIALPEDPVALPPGLGADAVLANCTACHSPSTMFTQPRLTRAKWEAQVEKMVEVYKAPVDPVAVPAIVDYLVAQQAAR